MNTATQPFFSATCFNCAKPLKHGVGKLVITEDDGGQRQQVGSDCFKKIKAAGRLGYPQGGKEGYVRLFAVKPS